MIIYPLVLRSCFQLGTHTLCVPVSLHATNRKQLCERLKKAKGVSAGAVVLLQGGEQKQRDCTDRDIVFRQVSKTYKHLVDNPAYIRERLILLGHKLNNKKISTRAKFCI